MGSVHLSLLPIAISDVQIFPAVQGSCMQSPGLQAVLCPGLAWSTVLSYNQPQQDRHGMTLADDPQAMLVLAEGQALTVAQFLCVPGSGQLRASTDVLVPMTQPIEPTPIPSSWSLPDKAFWG
jgi:hypothetical protein